MLDVNRREHRLLAFVRASVAALHARALPVFDDKARDGFIREYDAAVRFNQPGKRLRQSSRAALRRRPAPPLPPRTDRVSQAPGCRRLGWLDGLVSHPHHKRAAVLVLEIAAN